MKRAWKKSWIKFLLLKINPCLLYLKYIYIYRSGRKIAEPNRFPQDLPFQISETAKVRLPELEIERFDELLSIGVVFGISFQL